MRKRETIGVSITERDSRTSVSGPLKFVGFRLINFNT